MTQFGFGPLQYEELPWVAQVDLDTISRRERSKIPVRYQAAIAPAIAAARLDMSSSQAAATEDAAAAISRFEAHVTATLGDSDLAPMQAVLLRSESAASSQIENLTVGARQLALAELGVRASPNAQLVVKNVAAMSAAIRLADNLDAESILTMQAALMSTTLGRAAGRWRQQQVWIGASASSPAGADFVPPHHGRVPAAMDDLVAFMRRDDLPVVVQAALSHAQFETVHPFIDGNGRTGRALLHALLRNKRLARRVTVPVSAGLLQNTQAYFNALMSYRAGDVDPIVTEVCEAAHRAVAQGRWLVDELVQLAARWTDDVAPRRGSAAERLLRVLPSQPAVHVALIVERLGVSETAARRAIERAAGAGVLRETSDRSRDRVWIAPDVLEILDDFASRAGRRSQ